ncbi:hypothetical protein AXF42_Ash018285 [Apostasia shenzhenica]|uniref:Uncharacterized protein n=1 Tax=Apostasia shenzhenica TaxID=1088818 RepID=A0A2I0B2N4_9ASPA|nr:hypothetical protein AXF42_Ash018285 [Apostasia shenzhenica]
MEDHGKDNSTDAPSFDLNINIEESSHIATEKDNNEIGGSSYFAKKRTKKQHRDIAYRSSRLEYMNRIADGLQKLSSTAGDTNGYHDNLLTNIYQELHAINRINDDKIEYYFGYFTSCNRILFYD